MTKHVPGIGFLLALLLAGCAGRNLATEVTSCTYPDSTLTPAPSFICGAAVPNFPVTTLRSDDDKDTPVSERIDRVFEDQLARWSAEWSAEWVDMEAQAEAQIWLQDYLNEHARVVRSRVSPRNTLWLLIGIPDTMAAVQARLQQQL